MELGILPDLIFNGVKKMENKTDTVTMKAERERGLMSAGGTTRTDICKLEVTGDKRWCEKQIKDFQRNNKN
jgi:hypothetical protein